jgi:hypothetical protein
MTPCPQPKRCARRGCPRFVTSKAPHARFCGRACCQADFQEKAIARAKAAGADPMRHIRELQAETPPGCCPMCDTPLPPHGPGLGRRRVICGARECLRGYNSAYQNARRNPPEAPRGEA